jgi:hypothetical protein
MNALQTTELASFAVTIVPEAIAAKANALTLATQIKTVANAEQQRDAIAAASLMKGLLRDVEKAREEVKKPVLDAVRKIDAAAKSYAAELDAEVKRVERLASEYQAEQNRIAAALKAEEERKAREAREAEEAERRREAEALRKLAEEQDRARREELAAIAAAKDEAEREKAQAEADRQAEIRAEEARLVQQACREAEAARLDAERERATTAMAIVPPKAEGARTKVFMDYELKDIRALYAARPDLVELTERRSAILAAISIPGQPAIPGLYVFESTKVQSKAS